MRWVARWLVMLLCGRSVVFGDTGAICSGGYRYRVSAEETGTPSPRTDRAAT
jgi:hypothetical protein